jgi:hypothetical protein
VRGVGGDGEDVEDVDELDEEAIACAPAATENSSVTASRALYMSTPPPVSCAASTANLSIAACNADAYDVTRATAQDVYDQMYVVRVRDGDTRERVDAALATIYEANAGACPSCRPRPLTFSCI